MLSEKIYCMIFEEKMCLLTAIILNCSKRLFCVVNENKVMLILQIYRGETGLIFNGTE